MAASEPALQQVAPEPSPRDLANAIGRVAEKLDAHREHFDSRLGELADNVLSLGERLRRAEDIATRALRAANDVKIESDNTQKAMMAHAASVTATVGTMKEASDAVVASNAAQTPVIESTLYILQTIKKNAPAILAAVVIVATALGTFLGTIVQAYLKAKGQ